MNLSKSDIIIVAVASVALWWVAYIIICGIETIQLLSTANCAALLFKPTFNSIPMNVTKERAWTETSRQGNYAGLHTPIYRVLNHTQRFILDNRISRDFDIHMNRGQQKWIYREGVLNIRLARGYSAVTIGARTIFAVDEWDRTIYHIDSMGRMCVADYTQDYDMSDVIAQVSEALEVIADHYNAEKYKAIDEEKAKQEWYCYSADNLGVVNDWWKRATVNLWHIQDSKGSVEWRKYWGRMTPTGAKEYKETTGAHPSAYRVVIGDKPYWIPHSICSRTTELYGGRQARHAGDSRFLGHVTTVQSLDLPVWWLEKNIGVDWSDKVEAIGHPEFLKRFKKQRRWFKR